MKNLLRDLMEEMDNYYDYIIVLLPKLAIALVVLLFVLFVGRFFRRKLIKLIDSRIDDPLLGSFLNRIFKISNVIIAILLFLSIIGKSGIVKSIMGVAGLSAFVIGFAFKDIGENFLAGVIMAFKRPFRLGDTIETGGIAGTIVELNLRDTHVKTFDGKDVYIPNGQILKTPLFNYTIDGFIRKEFIIRVDYDCELNKAISIVDDTLKHQIGIIQEEKTSTISIAELTPTAIHLLVRFWVNTFDAKEPGYITQNKLINQCLHALGEAGIETPGNVVEVKKASVG